MTSLQVETPCENFLSDYCPQVELIGEAENIITGKSEIESKNPDVVFLDVEMPHGNGFDLLESLNEINFEVIFVTAFSHYAIKAIQHSAANYILKPVDIDELQAAVDKITPSVQNQPNSIQILLSNIKAGQNQLTKVVLPVLNGFEVVVAEEIIYCKAEENFTRFKLTDGRELMICRTLKFYQETLEPLGFLRIHKSYVINLNHLRKYHKGRGGDVVMIDQSELPVSPAQKEALLNFYRT